MKGGSGERKGNEKGEWMEETEEMETEKVGNKWTSVKPSVMLLMAKAQIPLKSSRYVSTRRDM